MRRVTHDRCPGDRANKRRAAGRQLLRGGLSSVLHLESDRRGRHLRFAGNDRPGLRHPLGPFPGRGWPWCIPLPKDVVSVGIVADPDYLFDESKHFEDVFVREVQRCAPLLARLSSAIRIAPAHGLRRLAYRNRQVVGNGWVMAGDAAAFLNPIYSSGLYLALASAELAAGCIHEALAANDCSAERLGAYVPALMDGVEIIRRLRRDADAE